MTTYFTWLWLTKKKLKDQFHLIRYKYPNALQRVPESYKPYLFVDPTSIQSKSKNQWQYSMHTVPDFLAQNSKMNPWIYEISSPDSPSVRPGDPIGRAEIRHQYAHTTMFSGVLPASQGKGQQQCPFSSQSGRPKKAAGRQKIENRKYRMRINYSKIDS